MKFNSRPLRNQRRALNYEGEKAFVLSPQLELYSAVVTTSGGV